MAELKLELTRRNDLDGLPWQFFCRIKSKNGPRSVACPVESLVGEDIAQFLIRIQPELNGIRKAMKAALKRAGHPKGQFSAIVFSTAEYEVV
jgi:hypothetical protein